MKKILYIFALILTAGIFLPSCSDDKNEPDDPNKGASNPSSLADVVNGEKYIMEFPLKFTYVNSGRIDDPIFTVWTAGGKKADNWYCYTLKPFDNYWGKDDYYSIIIERTDGKKLEPYMYSYIDTKEALIPRLDLRNDLQQDSLLDDYTSEINLRCGNIDGTEDRIEGGGLCIDKMSDYKYKITMKVQVPDADGICTRFAQVDFKEIYPTRITSLDGKTEYRITEDVLATSPDRMCHSIGIYSIPPAGVQASARRNVFLDDMGSGVIQKMKKVKRQ